VPWTTQQFADRPGTLRICQNAGATDRTADYLDVETDAATVADCPGWLEEANANWDAAARPGQRKPAIYVNGSNITAVANILTAADLSCGLIVANWNLDQAQAIAAVSAASGPFPVHGLQYADPGPYDIDVWSAAWLNEVSGPHKPPPPSLAWPTVAIGATGARVMTIQHLLSFHGFVLTADGIYGPATKACVAGFQAGESLADDGIVGPLTWASLVVTVQSGNTGVVVIAVQAALNAADDAGLPTDGIFGVQTLAAVRGFQAIKKLTVDGVVGPDTWAALSKAE
jgi:hypothetical protein